MRIRDGDGGKNGGRSKKRKNKTTRHLYLSVKMYEIYYPPSAIPLYTDNINISNGGSPSFACCSSSSRGVDVTPSVRVVDDGAGGSRCVTIL